MTRKMYVRAGELRQQGMLIKQIAQELSLDYGLIYRWVRDIYLTDETIDTMELQYPGYRKKYEIICRKRLDARDQRLRWQNEGRERARSYMNSTAFFDSDHPKASMLYWGEGSKSPYTFSFVNTSATMIMIITRFLRTEMCVSDSKIKLRVQCYIQAEDIVKKIEEFWLSTTNLPRENLYKTQLRVQKSNGKVKYPNGMCNVTVHNTPVVQHVFGAIQEYGGFDRPEWLG
jgi:hypothetical protein